MQRIGLLLIAAMAIGPCACSAQRPSPATPDAACDAPESPDETVETPGADVPADAPEDGFPSADTNPDPDGAAVDGGPCPLSAAWACEDGDSCTADTLDETCACRHRPRAEASPCDDGDPCTWDDRCVAGMCRGERRMSVPSVLGHLGSFGHALGLTTVVAFPSPTRAVFARSRQVTLVGLDGDEATVLDDVPATINVAIDSISAMIRGLRLRTFLIPVLEHHLVVASQDQGILLFDLAGDRLTLVKTWSLPEFPLKAMIGRGGRLFSCVSRSVQSWSLDGATLELTKDARVELPPGATCQDLALSPDGNVLYAATADGLHTIDLTGPVMTIGAQALSGHFLANVQAHGDHIAVFDVKSDSSGHGDVVVLSADGLAVVTTFALDSPTVGTYSEGFSLLDGDRILLQTYEAGSPKQQAVLHTLGNPTVELARYLVAESHASPVGKLAFQTVSRGTIASVEPMHQLLHIDPSTSFIRPIPSPRQGSFEYVRGDGPDAVLAYGPASTHRIDISDPARPHVLQGGPQSPATMESLRFDIAQPPALRRLPVYESESSSKRPYATLLSTHAAGLPVPVGNVANEEANGTWATGRGGVYQLTAAAASSFRLRRFTVTSFIDSVGRVATPAVALTLDTEVPAGFDVRQGQLFAVDAVNGDLVIVERRAGTGVSVGSADVLSVFQESGDAYTRRFSKVLPAGSPKGVMAAGGTIAVSPWPRLFDRDGDERTPTYDDSSWSAYDVIHMDAATLVLSVGFVPSTLGKGVVLVRTQDLSEIARYATKDPNLPATSFAVVGNHYVFGSPAALTVAAPSCPGP